MLRASAIKAAIRRAGFDLREGKEFRQLCRGLSGGHPSTSVTSEQRGSCVRGASFTVLVPSPRPPVPPRLPSPLPSPRPRSLSRSLPQRCRGEGARIGFHGLRGSRRALLSIPVAMASLFRLPCLPTAGLSIQLCRDAGEGAGMQHGTPCAALGTPKRGHPELCLRWGIPVPHKDPGSEEAEDF